MDPARVESLLRADGVAGKAETPRAGDNKNYGNGAEVPSMFSKGKCSEEKQDDPSDAHDGWLA